jgi:hypothetical protein
VPGVEYYVVFPKGMIQTDLHLMFSIGSYDVTPFTSTIQIVLRPNDNIIQVGTLSPSIDSKKRLPHYDVLFHLQDACETWQHEQIKEMHIVVTVLYSDSNDLPPIVSQASGVRASHVWWVVAKGESKGD